MENIKSVVDNNSGAPRNLNVLFKQIPCDYKKL